MVSKNLNSGVSVVFEEMPNESDDLLRSSPDATSTSERTKETPLPWKHQLKMVSKNLTSDFSAVSKETPTESDDLLHSSPVASRTIKGLMEKDLISPRRLPIAEDYGSRRSVEITVRKPVVVKEMLDRLQEALLEVRKSPDVSGESKLLLSALVEVAVGDVGCDPGVEQGRPDSVLWEKVRIGIICVLILLVAIMNFFGLTALMDCRGRWDLPGLSTPT